MGRTLGVGRHLATVTPHLHHRADIGSGGYQGVRLFEGVAAGEKTAGWDVQQAVDTKLAIAADSDELMGEEIGEGTTLEHEPVTRPQRRQHAGANRLGLHPTQTIVQLGTQCLLQLLAA